MLQIEKEREKRIGQATVLERNLLQAEARATFAYEREQVRRRSATPAASYTEAQLGILPGLISLFDKIK